MEQLYHLTWYFFLYAFLGWCTEVTVFAVGKGKFVNRGFLNGPVCPVYGFGMAIVLVCLQPFSDSLLLLFFSSMLLCTALEFFTGWILEAAFHAKWWDYSQKKFNVRGYICLENSIYWGFAATGILRLVHPLLRKLIDLIPQTFGTVLLIVLLVLLFTDLTATIVTIRNLQKRLRILTKLAAEIHDVSDRIGDSLSGKVLAVKQKAEEEQAIYIDYNALCDAHRAEEKALYEQHHTEEMAVLAAIRSEQKERHSVALTEKRAELSAKLHEHRFGQNRLLRAFPELKLREGQAAFDKLADSIKNRRKREKHDKP